MSCAEKRRGVNERIDEGVLRWFCHLEIMTRLLRGYMCAGSRSVGRPGKRLIYTMKDRIRKRGLDVRQTRRMAQNRSEWRGFVKGRTPGNEPLTLMVATAI